MIGAIAPPPTLRPLRVKFVRVIWVVVSTTAVVLFFIGFSNTKDAPLPTCTTPGADCSIFEVSQEDAQIAEQMGLPISLKAATSSIPFLLTRIGYIFVALFVFWRKSDDWVAAIFSFSLMMGILEGVVESTGALKPVAALLYGMAGGFFVILPLVFPNGRFEPHWTCWIAIPLACTEAFLLAIIPTSALNGILWTVVSTIAIYAIVYRYRRVSNAVERQQTKWAVAGLLVIFGYSFFSFGLGALFPVLQPSPGRVVFTLINGYLYPGTSIVFLTLFAIAILRYRLWDIDLFIRRTLQYTILTGLLALVYFGGIVTLQGILRPLTGDTNSPLVTVITTLGIAALFNPLRRRVQDFIDRRFFRKKYNAEQTLANFAAVARDEVDMDNLTSALLRVVEETMQPERLSLWLKPYARNVKRET